MSGKKKQPPMRMQNVFIFLLLAIFAISAIFLTALGARIYRETVDTSNQNNTARIVTAIIRGAVQSDDTGIVSVTEEDGLPILLFTNDYDGETYYRRIYCADGYLRDCLVSAELEFEKDLGRFLRTCHPGSYADCENQDSRRRRTGSLCLFTGGRCC